MMILPELLMSFVLLLIFIFTAGKLSALVQNRFDRRVYDQRLDNFVSNLVYDGFILVGIMIMVQNPAQGL